MINGNKLAKYLSSSGFSLDDDGWWRIHIDDLGDDLKPIFKSLFQMILTEGEKALGDIYYDQISFEVYYDSFWMSFRCLGIGMSRIGGAYIFNDKCDVWVFLVSEFRNRNINLILGNDKNKKRKINSIFNTGWI